ncbi:hypothetical protein BDV27DRAFT_151656 [Aspergillus caelatus]|uniref:Uncharacterized protein n=2 Tax=Aspergillus subgen. Circumdati TaxID=2720871 RepID=A0A5N7AM81_9EURO|nr:uncharacterized protein BDV27DRAFT_151656 [Aspergillus caelatus]KAE8370803.1 hypothetical protein BDV27DRAFT_151656 [Aspergillus caelatus]KAE8418617.1 hypothetical protein BDV36DRAFT_295039 [Aspergillus pseudocaelatus]
MPRMVFRNFDFARAFSQEWQIPSAATLNDYLEPHPQPEDQERARKGLLIGCYQGPVPSDGVSAALGAKSAPLGMLRAEDEPSTNVCDARAHVLLSTNHH